MVNKFEKQTKCLYCESDMQAKYRNKKFCSDKCRVYYGRENTKEKPLPVVNVQDLTKLNKILKPKSQPVSNFNINLPPKNVGESGIDYKIRIAELNQISK